MSWLSGKIEVFPGGKEQHRSLRKIRTEKGQAWDEMFFFHVDEAKQVGYPESLLGPGCTIEFEPHAGSEKPRVGRFKPYEVGAAPRPRGDGRSFHNPYHFLPLEKPPKESLLEADT
jgi:hypothetical protein